MSGDGLGAATTGSARLLADRAPLVVPGLVVGLLAAAGGGFFPRSWGWSAAALAALAGLALVVDGPSRLGRLELAALLALGALAGWTALSALWSLDPSASLREARRALVYVAGLAAVVLVARRRAPRVLLGALLAAILAVCAYGVVDHAFAGGRVDPYQGTTLFEPLGYANALAVFAALGAVLAAAFAVQARRPQGRVLAAAAFALAVVAVALTRSRGGWLALAVGLVVALAFARRPLRRWLPALVALAVAGSLGLGATGSLGGNRPDYWRVAWHEFRAHPAGGSGAGTFDRYWLRDRPVPESVRDAHSLYVETLGELGVVGLALVAAALALPLVAAARARPDPLVAGAGGAFAAFAVHAALDWDWEMPAVTLAALACGGALVAAAPPGGRRLGFSGRPGQD